MQFNLTRSGQLDVPVTLLSLLSVQSGAAFQCAVHSPQNTGRRQGRLLEVQRIEKLQEKSAEEQGGSVCPAGPDQVPCL